MAFNTIATLTPPKNPYTSDRSLTPWRTRPHIEARERDSNGKLISLAEPIPGQEGLSLAEVLREKAMHMQARDHPQTRVAFAACTVIVWLDQQDHTAGADPQTCHSAAEALLQLGQGPLLQRLAAVTGLTFQLNLGASARCADVLLGIDRPWPRGVPLSLELNTRMLPEKIEALQAFVLKFPNELSLYVQAQMGAPVPGTAEALACTLKTRGLETLALACGASSVSVVQAMVGVSAQAICVRAERTHAEAAQPVVELHGALTELVRLSGAKQLNVVGCSSVGVLSEDLALKLLNCRQDWSMLQLAPFAGEGKVAQWLAAGQRRIGKLEVFGCTAARSPLDLLQAAEKNQVHTLVFDRDVDVILLAECLDRQLQTTQHVFERIEACLTYLPGEHARARQALNSILSNPMVVWVRHVSGRAGEGRMSIDDMDAIQLNQAGASGRLVPLPQRLEQLQQAARQRAEQREMG